MSASSTLGASRALSGRVLCWWVLAKPDGSPARSRRRSINQSSDRDVGGGLNFEASSFKVLIASAFPDLGRKFKLVRVSSTVESDARVGEQCYVQDLAHSRSAFSHRHSSDTKKMGGYGPDRADMELVTGHNA